MNRYLAILCLLLLGISVNTYGFEYNVGVVDYPPHIVVKDKIPSGRAIDYIQNFMDRNGDSVVFTVLPVMRGQKQLVDGNIDLLLPIENFPVGSVIIKKPFLKLVPGLCFRKDNFVPILSATHRLKSLKIGYADGSDLPKTLKESGASLIALKGISGHERGIKMLKANRFDALYHANPVFIYHHKNPLSKDVACSYFHGLTTHVYITVSPILEADKAKHIQSAFTKAIEEQSYRDFYNAH